MTDEQANKMIALLEDISGQLSELISKVAWDTDIRDAVAAINELKTTLDEKLG